MRLRDAVLGIDVGALIVDRDPSVRELKAFKGWGGFKAHGMQGAWKPHGTQDGTKYVDEDVWPEDTRDDPDDPDGWLSMERAEVERELRAIETRERSMIEKRYQDVH
jgi:hypothetical protein